MDTSFSEQDIAFREEVRQFFAEMFFNSAYCSVLQQRQIRDEYAFVLSPQGDLPAVGDAILDRLMHNAHRLPLKGGVTEKSALPGCPTVHN